VAARAREVPVPRADAAREVTRVVGCRAPKAPYRLPSSSHLPAAPPRGLCDPTRASQSAEANAWNSVRGGCMRESRIFCRCRGRLLPTQKRPVADTRARYGTRTGLVNGKTSLRPRPPSRLCLLCTPFRATMRLRLLEGLTAVLATPDSVPVKLMMKARRLRCSLAVALAGNILGRPVSSEALIWKSNGSRSASRTPCSTTFKRDSPPPGGPKGRTIQDGKPALIRAI